MGLQTKRGVTLMLAALAACALFQPGCARKKASNDVTAITQKREPTPEEDRKAYEDKTLFALIESRDSRGIAWKLKNQKPNIEERNNDGLTPLMFAARYGNAVIAKSLLEAGAQVDALGDREVSANVSLEKFSDIFEPFRKIKAKGYTALMWALRNGADDVVQVLIEHGANVNHRTEAGDIPLTESAKWGHARQINLLLNAGARINDLGEDGWTALMWTLHRRKTDAFRELMNARAGLNVLSTQGDSAVAIAAQAGAREELALMLERGANPHFVNHAGENALHKAARVHAVETLILLLQARVHVNARDSFGETPLHMAVDSYWQNASGAAASATTAQALIKGGADINAKTGSKRTALMLAAMRSNVDAVQVLLAAGADAKIQTSRIFGKTALDFANDEATRLDLNSNPSEEDQQQKARYQEIIAILTQAMAR